MEAKELGAFIAQIRKENQMTQAQLAACLKVTDKAVSRWERGMGFPDIQTLEPLAEALGVTLTELMKCQKMRTSDSGQRCRIDAFNLQYISKRYRLFCDLYIPVCFYIYIIRIRGHLLHLLFISSFFAVISILFISVPSLTP